MHVYCFASSTNYKNDETLQHARLGHIGQQRMNNLAKEGYWKNIKKVYLSTCEYCLTRKTIR